MSFGGQTPTIIVLKEGQLLMLKHQDAARLLDPRDGCMAKLAFPLTHSPQVPISHRAVVK